MLQAQLRKKLQALPQYNGLQPQQLLEEYRALQMMMIYNGPAAAGGDHRTAKDQGKLDNKKTGIDEEVEEFLLQQVGWLCKHCPSWPVVAMLKLHS